MVQFNFHTNIVCVGHPVDKKKDKPVVIYMFCFNIGQGGGRSIFSKRHIIKILPG